MEFIGSIPNIFPRAAKLIPLVGSIIGGTALNFHLANIDAGFEVAFCILGKRLCGGKYEED